MCACVHVCEGDRLPLRGLVSHNGHLTNGAHGVYYRTCFFFHCQRDRDKTCFFHAVTFV